MMSLLEIPDKFFDLTGRSSIQSSIVISDPVDILWPELPCTIENMELSVFIQSLIKGDCFALFSIYGSHYYRDVDDEWFTIRREILNISKVWQFKTNSFYTYALSLIEQGFEESAKNILFLGCEYFLNGNIPNDLKPSLAFDCSIDDSIEIYNKYRKESIMQKTAPSDDALRAIGIKYYLKSFSLKDKPDFKRISVKVDNSEEDEKPMLDHFFSDSILEPKKTL